MLKYRLKQESDEMVYYEYYPDDKKSFSVITYEKKTGIFKIEELLEID